MDAFRYLLVSCVLFSVQAGAQVGALDPTFGTDGIQTTDLLPSDIAWDVTVLGNSDIVVVGSSLVAGTPFAGSGQATLARYTPDGVLDLASGYTRSVGGCGIVPVAFFSVLAEPDGNYVAAGYANWTCGIGIEFWIERLTADHLDVLTFEPPEFHGLQSQAWALARQPDGKIISAGFAGSTGDGASRDVAVARHSPGGMLDDTFGTGGEVLVDVAGDYDFAYNVDLQPDGKLVVAGFTYDGSQYDFLILRLNEDGTLDPSFGVGGIVTIDFDGLNDFALDSALQADGKILAAGVRNNDDTTATFTIVRLETDGTLDAGFGAGGITTLDFTGLSARADALLLQSDGKIVVAGRTETGTGGDDTLDFAIARLHPDGTLDTTFGSDGMQTADVGGPIDTARGLAIEPDGDLVVVGSAQEDVGGDLHSDFGLARFIGDAIPVANEPEAGLPSGFALHAVYPNPFKLQAVVPFDVPEGGPVRVALYNLLGREVGVLVDGVRSAGHHEAVLNGSGLPSGVYLVRMTAGGSSHTRTLTLLR